MYRWKNKYHKGEGHLLFVRVCQNIPTEHFDRDVPAHTMDLQDDMYYRHAHVATKMD